MVLFAQIAADPTVVQIGVGGVFALLIVRLVLDFLSKQKSKNGSAGDKPVEFWEGTFRKINKESLNETIVPILQQQTRILEAIQVSDAKVASAMMELLAITRARERRGD